MAMSGGVPEAFSFSAYCHPPESLRTAPRTGQRQRGHPEIPLLARVPAQHVTCVIPFIVGTGETGHLHHTCTPTACLPRKVPQPAQPRLLQDAQPPTLSPDPLEGGRYQRPCGDSLKRNISRLILHLTE